MTKAQTSACWTGVSSVSQDRHVLVVAYLFPPIGGIGVQRALKFIRYLREFGYEPIVLTTEHAYSSTMDASLLDQIPKHIQIVRVADPLARIMQKTSGVMGNTVPVNLDLSSTSVKGRSKGNGIKQKLKQTLKKLRDTVCVPDESIWWSWKAIRVARQLVKEYQVECVFTTSSPVSAHLVGWMTKNWTRVKWIADFRDPWTDNMHFVAGPFRRRFERWLEASVMNCADAITTVTEGFCDLFAKRYPQIRHKTKVIRNGVDPEDFPIVERLPITGPITFLYAGILYPKRSPEVFLRALAQCIAEGKIKHEDICIQFAGVFDYPGQTGNSELVRELGLQEVVEQLGYLKHDEVAVRMMQAHALLLIGDADPDAGLYIPGKLYEYIFAERPILALMQQGEGTKLIEQYAAGKVVSTNNLHDVAEAIEQMVQDIRQTHEMPALKRASLFSLTRQAQTEQLAQLMNHVIEIEAVKSTQPLQI